MLVPQKTLIYFLTLQSFFENDSCFQKKHGFRQGIASPGDMGAARVCLHREGQLLSPIDQVRITG